ncbi:alpha/beta hydrolase [Nonomuraea sp. NPDC050022]|uniref:alpha/beta hydrolase n=1 Tax=unclassified Nonomuraea TaxID=2593643 RepID=UPI0033F5612D
MVKEALAFFAPYFVKAGFAVLAIDYRTVGSSEGEPRGLDYPERQAEDFRSAVSYLQTRPEIQPERIGVWGVWQKVIQRKLDSLGAFGEIADEGLDLVGGEEHRAERIKAAHDSLTWLQDLAARHPLRR